MISINLKTFFLLLVGALYAETDKSTVYSPVGKRDPFTALSIKSVGREPATLGIWERYPIEKIQLRAVLKGFGRPRALFEDPEGKTFVLVEGDFIGREHAVLSRVIDSDVIVTEHTRNYLGAETLFERILTLRPIEDEIALWTQPEQQRPEVKEGAPAPAANTPERAPQAILERALNEEAPLAVPKATEPPKPNLDFGQNISPSSSNIK